MTHASVRRWLLPASMAVVIGAGCGSNEGDRVAVVGDSITSFDKPALRDDLGNRYDLTIVGDFGATIAEVMPAARLVAKKDLDQVIINLGTNDVIAGRDLGGSLSTLSSMIDRFDASCVHVVDINEHMVNKETGELLHDRAQAINTGLAELADRRERVSIIGWNGVVEETLDDSDPPTSTLTKDSTHPTSKGNARLNVLYADALASC